MEVMAAVMLLAITLTVILSLRDQAVGRAANARSLAVATRLANLMMHRIEGGLVPEIFDGLEGDFAEEGFAEFSFRLGIGEGSIVALDNVETDSPEYAWRRDKEEAWEAAEGEEDDNGVKPEKTRVVVAVQWPKFSGDPQDYRLESLIETWAVRQDFELWEATWGNIDLAEVE
jgi:hypothetical protein